MELSFLVAKTVKRLFEVISMGNKAVHFLSKRGIPLFKKTALQLFFAWGNHFPVEIMRCMKLSAQVSHLFRVVWWASLFANFYFINYSSIPLTQNAQFQPFWYNLCGGQSIIEFQLSGVIVAYCVYRSPEIMTNKTNKPFYLFYNLSLIFGLCRNKTETRKSSLRFPKSVFVHWHWHIEYCAFLCRDLKKLSRNVGMKM